MTRVSPPPHLNRDCGVGQFWVLSKNRLFVAPLCAKGRNTIKKMILIQKPLRATHLKVIFSKIYLGDKYCFQASTREKGTGTFYPSQHQRERDWDILSKPAAERKELRHSIQASTREKGTGTFYPSQHQRERNWDILS